MYKFNKHLFVLSLSIFALLALVGNANAYDWAGKQPEISAATMAANPNNHTPVIQSLSASVASVDSGGSLQLTATASDPDGDSLTYFWSAPKGEFGSCSGACSDISWIAPSVSTSTSVTISLEVGDKKGRAAWRTVTVTVRPGGSGGDDTTDPVVAMSEPAGGNYTEGDLLTARWSAFDDTGLSHFVLEKYLSSSAAWQTISSSIAGDLTSISWTAQLGVTKLRITAYDEAGNHASATSASFTVTAEPCPTRPDAPTLKNPGVTTPNNFVRVQWYGVDCAEEYTLFVGKGDAYTEYTTVTVDSEEYLLANLSNDTYYFKVKARNSHGESGWSPVKFITVAINHPPNQAFHPYPVNGATNVQRQNLTLAWDIDDDPDDDIITSAPYLGTSPSNMTRQQGFSNVLTYDCATLDACTTYYWRIDTRDPDDFITTGSTWTFTTECNQADPAAFSIDVSGEVRLYDQVDLSIVVGNQGEYRSSVATIEIYLSSTAGGQDYYVYGGSTLMPDLAGGTQTTLHKTITLADYPSETFYITAIIDPHEGEDANPNNNMVSAQATFLDEGAPEISWGSQFYSDGGNVYGGQEIELWWSAQDDGNVASCDIYYHVHPSGTWNHIASVTEHAPNSPYGYRYFWEVPSSLIGSQIRWKATCIDDAGHEGSRESGTKTVIDPTPPTVRVTWPNGGEVLVASSVVTITWELSVSSGIKAIRVTSENCGSASTILETNSFTTSTPWTVPNASDLHECIIRVDVEDTAYHSVWDTSDSGNEVMSTFVYRSPWTVPTKPFGTGASSYNGTNKIALDSLGNVHMVSVQDRDLYYNKFTASSGEWGTPKLLLDISSDSYVDDVDIILDPVNRPHVAFSREFDPAEISKSFMFITSLDLLGHQSPIFLIIPIVIFILASFLMALACCMRFGAKGLAIRTI